MQYKKILFNTLVIFSSGTISLIAQETIPASGITASGSGGSASCTIGQIISASYNSTLGSVAHGVQQAYEVSVIYGIEEYAGITLQISSYPNPVNDLLVLKADNYNSMALTYKLFDLNGRLLLLGKAKDNETNINMSSYKPATYLLKVFAKRKGITGMEIKTFTIIKN